MKTKEDLHSKSHKAKSGLGSDAATCYDVCLTRKHMQVIDRACDILSRLGMNQIGDALDALPTKDDIDWGLWHESIHDIKKELLQHMPKGANTHGSSLGMGNSKVSPNAKVACDIHQAFRRFLSWEKAVEDGIISSMDSSRNFFEMLTVDYDEPFKYSDEPLPEISRHNVKFTGA